MFGQSCLCVTFTSWSTPFPNCLIGTHMCVHPVSEWSVFLPFSVNCSVAMFQIMPALCPHGQGEGVVNQMWTGLDRGRGPKNSQICADILYGWPQKHSETLRSILKTHRWNKKLFSRKNNAKWIDELKAQKGLYNSKLYWTLSYFSFCNVSLIGIPIGVLQ